MVEGLARLLPGQQEHPQATSLDTLTSVESHTRAYELGDAYVLALGYLIDPSGTGRSDLVQIFAEAGRL